MHIQHQHTGICHPYTPLLYMYIAPIYTINIYVHSTHIHNQYTCIYHPYIHSIYMHISSIYTINIYAHSTHIHNKYTCIQHPYIPSIYIYIITWPFPYRFWYHPETLISAQGDSRLLIWVEGSYQDLYVIICLSFI